MKVSKRCRSFFLLQKWPSPHKYFHRLVLVETKLYLFCNYTLMQVCSVKFPKISPAVTKRGKLLVWGSENDEQFEMADDSLQKMEPSSVNSVTQLVNLKLKPIKEAWEVNNGLSQHNISSTTELLKPYICSPNAPYKENLWKWRETSRTLWR